VSDDRYGNDVLAHDPYAKRPVVIPEVLGELGLVVECADSGWCGAIIGWEKSIEGWSVLLEDRDARVRMFPALAGAFLIDGERTTITRPAGSKPVVATRTASGSRAVADARARVARGSRIWVEGKHDAELIEKVWGDDLRIEGVVVELLDGVDNLPDMLAEFSPDLSRRVGVLVDHLVEGSKETRMASQVMSQYPKTVLVLGHPFVDVWQAITPAAAGIDMWPTISRGTDWKTGVCNELGWPDDTALAWKQLLRRVTKWTDLDHHMLGPVEQLIDFVTHE